MEYLRRGRRRCGLVSKLAIICCSYICFVSLYAPLASDYSWSAHLDFRGFKRDSYAQVAAGQRRELSGGLGSHPPLCTAKCGGCTPCSPVQVAVPPGSAVTSKYYPVAWRCRCGGKLYMP